MLFRSPEEVGSAPGELRVRIVYYLFSSYCFLKASKGDVRSSGSSPSRYIPRKKAGNSRFEKSSFRYVLAIVMEIGRAHVCTPVTNAHLVCRLLLEKQK